jgi:D-alanyl-lipoteichoic acid acyltransferase DltB (MBOAT superfamily)
LTAPRWFMSALIKLLTGTAVWLSLASGYHTFALLFIGSGLHAPTSWDRDTFDKPLNSTSLFDFWRRWHQLFTVRPGLICLT